MTKRTARLDELLREEISAVIARDVNDPRIGFVTVTDVRTTTDIRQAQIYYTVLPDDDETRRQTESGLRSATPIIRRELGARLRTRLTPELQFIADPVPERGRRIEQILRDVPPAEERGEDDFGAYRLDDDGDL